jgi:hypothetical protein
MNCILLLKESVVVSRTKSFNKIRCSDEEFLNVECGYRPTCKHLHLQFEGSVSTPYGGQTVLPFGCFNPGNRTCMYLLDCRQGVPQCLSEFGSEENKNRWISEIVIRILINKMLNYYSHWVYNPQMLFAVQHTTYINSYMFRHRGAIFRELLQQRCTCQLANILAGWHVHVAVYVCHVCCITKCICWIICWL